MPSRETEIVAHVFHPGGRRLKDRPIRADDQTARRNGTLSSRRWLRVRDFKPDDEQAEFTDVSTVESRSTTQPLRRFTFAAGVLFIIAAIAWPLVEPLKGPILWDFGEHHGLDLGDLIAVPVFLAGAALIWRARRSHSA
jgi:hypothetical protein